MTEKLTLNCRYDILADLAEQNDRDLLDKIMKPGKERAVALLTGTVLVLHRRGRGDLAIDLLRWANHNTSVAWPDGEDSTTP